MFCINCGKSIDEDSQFCQYCGVKVTSVNETPPKKVIKKENSSPETMSIDATKAAYQALWDKFAEIHDAKDKEKEKYDDMTSLNVWEFLERISRNAFETFIQENKDDLNKQPYRTIEAMQTMFSFNVIGGYKLWLAEALLNKGKIGRLKYISFDNLLDDWKKEDFSTNYKSISDQMGICMSKYIDFRLDKFMEAAPAAKELTHATIESLKQTLIWQSMSGYFVGVIEARYRR